jgi:hypothetical protein
LWPASLQEVMIITVRFAFRPQDEQRISKSSMDLWDFIGDSRAMAVFDCRERETVTIPGATHLFEEPGPTREGNWH